MLPDLKLYLGCEIYYSHESISLLEKGWIPTLAGSKYILVEFSPMKDFKFIKNALQECLFAGYLPILAHVERYQCFQGKTSLVNDLIEMGVYIQINAMSIIGNAGLKVQWFTKKLLREELVHFIATDAHNTEKRSPSISQCKKYIRIFKDRKLIKPYVRIYSFAAVILRLSALQAAFPTKGKAVYQ